MLSYKKKISGTEVRRTEMTDQLVTLMFVVVVIFIIFSIFGQIHPLMFIVVVIFIIIISVSILTSNKQKVVTP